MASPLCLPLSFFFVSLLSALGLTFFWTEMKTTGTSNGSHDA